MTALEMFEPLLGEWETSGSFELGGNHFEPRGTWTIEPYGEYVLVRSTTDQPEFPDGMMFIGGREGGPPFLIHYFDDRGVHRRLTTSFEDGVWEQRRHPGDDPDGPDGPGFDQRFVGALSEDGKTMEVRFERSEDGENWELDFPMTFTRA
jgi:hypothetical protein